MMTCKRRKRNAAQIPGHVLQQRRDVLRIGRQRQGEVLQKQPDAQCGDDGRDPRRMAQRFIGEPFDHHAQQRRAQHGQQQRSAQRSNPAAVATRKQKKAPIMNTSPWAKLIMVRMP